MDWRRLPEDSSQVRIFLKKNLPARVRKPQMSFIADLNFGNKHQETFIRSMEPQPHLLEVKTGYFKEYDFVADGIKYEVKSDRYTINTGNICIEYECSGKASGIATSTADIWAYLVIDKDNTIVETYCIPALFLKSQIEAKTYSRDIKGGENWKNRMYLFKKEVFEDFLM